MIRPRLCLFLMCISLVFVARAAHCSNENGTLSITCPGTNDPSDYSKCCWNETSVHCCPHHISLSDDTERTVMIIGLAVIGSCIVIAVIIVICCFWSRCLLFNMCRVNYTYGDIVAYTKEEEALNSLPYEGGEKCRTYTPSQIKIKPVQDI
uniref:Uncharacterized protein n=1 Tax=Clastoptera arizonana TaxID=38151 RepID=A0A1B6CCJ2_9HEMI